MPKTPSTPTAPTPPSPSTGDQPAVPLPLMTRHRTVFEQAQDHITRILGKSPPPEDLMRMWLATATPWEVTRIFESAVLNITGSDLVPIPGEDYHQTLLAI